MNENDLFPADFDSSGTTFADPDFAPDMCDLEENPEDYEAVLQKMRDSLMVENDAFAPEISLTNQLTEMSDVVFTKYATRPLSAIFVPEPNDSGIKLNDFLPPEISSVFRAVETVPENPHTPELVFAGLEEETPAFLGLSANTKTADLTEAGFLDSAENETADFAPKFADDLSVAETTKLSVAARGTEFSVANALPNQDISPDKTQKLILPADISFEEFNKGLFPEMNAKTAKFSFADLEADKDFKTRQTDELNFSEAEKAEIETVTEKYTFVNDAYNNAPDYRTNPELFIAAMLNTDEKAVSIEDKYPVFEIEDKFFAFPAANVVEISRPLPVAPLPGAPSWLLGIANLRGDVVPIVSLRGFWGKPLALHIKKPKILILHSKKEDFILGLMVDQVREIRNLTAENISAPAEKPEPEIEVCLQGISEYMPNLPLVHLDAEKFLSLPRLRNLD